MKVPVACALALAIGVAGISRANAPSAVKANVLVAEASMKGSTIDPKLEHFSKDMKRQKFAYTSFAVVAETSLDLEMGKPGEVKLPSGRLATVEFRQVDTDGKYRVKVHAQGLGYVTISRAAGKELFFQADSVHGGTDTWLILTLSPR
jgi:hypothetical protein